MNTIFSICFSLFVIFSEVHCARILGFFFVPSVSHQYVFQPIWKALSLKGHEVTVITPNPLHDPKLVNLTEIDVSVGYMIFEKYDYSNIRRETNSLISLMQQFHDSFMYAFELEFHTDEVKKIMQKPEQSYDLIIIDAHNFMGYGLQHKFKAPLIAISPTMLSFYTHYLFGNPVHPVLYSDILSENYGSQPMWQKFENLYLMIVTWILCKFHLTPDLNNKARKYFGSDMPYLEDIARNNMIFANVNPVFSDRRPTVPSIMEFWGIHFDRKEVVSNDLQKILDNAKDGVVYFSLGTNVRFDHVQGNIKESILQALGELPYTVLCKWESEDFPGKPKNVILRKWFPQQSILAHPNVKLFVTQGGLQSSEEAIINGIPLVVIPFLGDQPMNAKILTTHGMAETIAPKDLNKDILRDTILKVLKDEKYRLKAQELRSIFLDQPQSGIDKIIWWCEYVIRHKGAKHLRSPSADISLYEYFMLDIFAVIVIVLFVIYKIISIILRRLIRLIKGDNSVSKNIEKKKKQ